MNENLTSLYLAEKSRVLTNMVLRRRYYCLEGESRLILTHTSSSTQGLFQTKVYQAKFFASKQDVYQVGLIPKWMYTEVPLYSFSNYDAIIKKTIQSTQCKCVFMHTKKNVTPSER
jgi:hypothetical protein